jgi:hypothetical protein
MMETKLSRNINDASIRQITGSLSGSLFVTAFAMAMASCGSSDFQSGNGNDKFQSGDGKPREPGEYDPTVHGSYLTWFLPCDENSGEPESPDGKKVLFKGSGDHKVNKADVAKHPIVFSGKVCAVTSMRRDVVLVVDVSGSMTDNDPRRNNTCARLRAVDQVVRVAARSAENQFAIVTFSDGVEAASSRFFTDPDELYRDLSPGGNVADVLCAEQGGTNYRSGLQESWNKLVLGRKDALKEVYFLSDGAPDRGKEGSDIAAQLKNGGVVIDGKSIKTTIATIMVGGANDAVLRDKIASTTPDGTLLHARADAGNLTTIMAQLAQNSIQSGQLLYRSLNGAATGTWQKVDLRPYIVEGGFVLPSMAVNPSTVTSGIEIRLEYVDRAGQKFTITGRLLWE